MAFHSDFWVVAGTAGPVVALSHAIAVERSIRRIPWSKHRRKIDLLAWIEEGKGPKRPRPTKGFRAAVSANWRSLNRWETFKRLCRLFVSLPVVLGPYVIALAGFGLSTGPTIDALRSLASESDHAQLSIARLQITWALLLLPVQAILTLSLDLFVKGRDEAK